VIFSRMQVLTNSCGSHIRRQQRKLRGHTSGGSIARDEALTFNRKDALEKEQRHPAATHVFEGRLSGTGLLEFCKWLEGAATLASEITMRSRVSTS